MLPFIYLVKLSAIIFKLIPTTGAAHECVYCQYTLLAVEHRRHILLLRYCKLATVAQRPLHLHGDASKEEENPTVQSTNK